MRVHVADDHNVMIDGYKMILNSFGIKVTGVSNNGVELIKWAEDDENRKNADVLILDISMQPMNGLDVMAYFKKHSISIPIVVASSYLNYPVIKTSFDFGALSYVSKTDGRETLGHAIVNACKGEKYIPDYVQEILEEQRLIEESKLLTTDKPLSKREFATLDLLLKQKTTDEIVDDLNMSKSTFRTIKSRIIEKYGVTNPVALIKKIFNSSI
ncbi:conserved hypothetical protein [Tenacibaculum sp. 190524A02b]|uniref:Response regulatory domain-containing protein n=1 Tax=Tenacibaculum vairaonense TaxID=3137860 RepID=A0ABP1FE37_9FLAO